MLTGHKLPIPSVVGSESTLVVIKQHHSSTV